MTPSKHKNKKNKYKVMAVIRDGPQALTCHI